LPPAFVIIETCLFGTQRRYYSLLPGWLKEKKAAGKTLIVIEYLADSAASDGYESND
jgi:hypothetical protein